MYKQEDIIPTTDDNVDQTNRQNELEEALRYLKHETKQMKESHKDNEYELIHLLH